MTKFKVGDKVVPTESTFGLTGKVGTIEKRGDMYDWLVVFENKAREPFNEECLVYFEEEEEMTEKKKFFRGQPVINSSFGKGVLLFDDGTGVSPLYVRSEHGSTNYCEYDELEPSDEFTFAQVVQGLLEGYFEEGTEFKVLGMSVFADKVIRHGFGLKRGKNNDFIEMEIGADLINATWKLVKSEPPIKELTIDELEEILGHKVKIKNND